jgi:hypothetical protein
VGVRANQLRAVLIPVGVAVISIGALAWYGMYWIPAKQRYLDERNVRLLRTIGVQIKVKVNNFDQAIDNAIESFEPDPTRPNSKDFQAYVRLFTPDLEIIDPADDHPKLDFADPPVVKVVLDEGKHYLYLGYSHGVERNGGAREKKPVIARADIEAAVGTYLSSHPEFDAIALLDHNGRAIVQQSTTGVEIANLDTTGAPATKRQRRDSAGGIENVRIGGADYRFYVQPVQLSLLRDTSDAPEEWKLCGLVRADHFRSASAEISSTYWLLLLAALTALLLAIPILKLHVMHPRERYHGVDGVATAASSFLLAGLLTFALLDAFYFGYRSNHETDARLSELARGLNTSLANEVNAASQELDMQVKALNTALRRTTSADTARRRIRLFDGHNLDCVHPLVCRTDLLLDPSATGQGRYPYYRLITWSDSSGWQRYKWTSARTVTPFIDISALPYVDDARRARRLSYDRTVAQGGVSVIRSPNSGEAVTVIWRALRPGEPENLRIASLVTTPISVTHPILTWGAQFAVVDLTGQVLYHSDSARSLNENFFQEAMDNGALRAAVVGRKKDSLSAEYFGRPYRMYVQPIDSSAWHGLADPRWSLIVFEQALIPETANVEALTVAGFMFVGYSLLLAIGWGVAHWVWPHGTDKWFWPDAKRTAAYMGVTAANAVLGLTFLFVVARRSPLVLLVVTLVMSLVAIAATFCTVQYSKQEDEPPPRARFHWFLMARVSFLFVVGVVPAMAAFQIAEGYENGLLLRRRSMHVTSELSARTERIARQQRSLRLCRKAEGCPEATAFLKRRREHLAYELPVPPSDATLSDVSSTMTGLASTLALGHRAYNSVAVELRAAMPGDPGGIFQPQAEYLVLAALLALLVVFVVRKLVWPLYALDLYRPPGFATSLGHKPSGNVLLVGPAGSGKTDILLRRAPGTRVFDVGTLAFVEVGDRPSPIGRSASPAARVEPAPVGGAAWVDSLNAYTIPEDGVLAIDHLDYRVDDPSFRNLMLPVLENFVYRRRYNVWIASSRDPAELLNVDPPVADPDRWTQLFREFRIQTVNRAGVAQHGDPEETSHITKAWNAFLEAHKDAPPDALSQSQKVLRDESAGWPRLNLLAAELTRGLTTEPPPSREDVLFEFGVAAESYYRALFDACSMDQKLALYQLAETGVVNPRNHTVVAQLLRKELVRRDPTFRVMNETFRRFVEQEMSHESAAEWEHEGVLLPWGSVSTMVLTLALLPLGLMLLTQQQLLGAWAGILPTLTPIVPSVVKLISAAPFGGKRAAVPA